MKQEEAKAKECPGHLVVMTMIQISLAIGDNKDLIDNTKKIGYCTASDCMMWVWDTSPKGVARLNAQSANHGIVAGGHCGLVKQIRG